jgi:DNA (cytosine-5)-methyltransferase 1
MENVLGLQSAAKGKFFTMVQAEARKLGYRVQAQVEESWRLCVLQKRRRQLVIGVRSDIPGYFPNELDPAERVRHLETPKLWAAIGDLPVLVAGEGEEQREYDLELRSAHLATRGAAACRYLRDVLEMDRAVKLTAHRARPHNARDLRDFAACGKASTAARPRRAAKSWSSPTIAPASPTDTSGNTGRTFAPPSSHTWARTG